MGTTLQHGIFLPAEGERNCYTGLASNWTILDGVVGGYSSHAANLTIHVTAADKEAWNGKADASALTAHTGDTTIHVTAADKEAWNGKADASALTAHTGNTTIHVTAADKEAWNGKADASALTAHTGNTTIHVTAADKQTWDTVTSKANDTDVVHKSGAETITGEKIFSKYITSDGSSTGGEYSGNAKTNLWLMANRDTEELSGVLFDTFRQNTAQGTGTHILGFGIKENSIRYEGCRFSWIWDNNLNGYSFSIRPTLQGTNQAVEHCLGLSTDKWDKINGINPGALSLPDLTAGVDISGYITLGTYQQDTYTPPSDGYISIMIYGTTANGLYIHSGSFGTGMRSIGGHPTYGQLSVVCVPVRAGITYTIENTGATSIGWAKFFPCQGNV